MRRSDESYGEYVKKKGVEAIFKKFIARNFPELTIFSEGVALISNHCK